VVPFPTNILSQYVLTPEQTVAAAVYNGWFLVIAVFFNLLWRYASNNGRLLSKPDHESGLAQIITDRYRWGIPTYFVAFALSFVWAPGGLAMNFALAVFYALPRELTLRWKR
jgi:hypothetical protein